MLKIKEVCEVPSYGTKKGFILQRKIDSVWNDVSFHKTYIEAEERKKEINN